MQEGPLPAQSPLTAGAQKSRHPHMGQEPGRGHRGMWWGWYQVADGRGAGAETAGWSLDTGGSLSALLTQRSNLWPCGEP